MAIREGYKINNIDRVLENKDLSLSSNYIELEIENEYTDKLIKLGEKLSNGLIFVALESQKFSSWSEYYSLFAITKSDITKFSKLLDEAINIVVSVFGNDTMIDSVDCCRSSFYYVMIFSRI